MITKRIAFLFCTVGLLAVSSFGVEAITTIQTSVNEVRLTIVATDSNGRPVSNLSPGQISLFENGRPVRDFDLRPASDLPLRLGIIFDLSDSMQKAWPMLRSSLAQPLQQLLQPKDQILLLAFDNKIELNEALTSPQQFDLLKLPRSAGLTALYDTLYLACKKEMLMDTVEPRRSALILFSDGEDNLSRHDLDEVTESAVSAGIAIYSVSSHSHRVHSDGDFILHQLAVLTGGRSFVAANASELQTALAIIQGELRSSYLLYYRAQEQMDAGRFRPIIVLPRDQQGLSLRSRAGYFIAH